MSRMGLEAFISIEHFSFSPIMIDPSEWIRACIIARAPMNPRPTRTRRDEIHSPPVFGDTRSRLSPLRVCTRLILLYFSRYLISSFSLPLFRSLARSERQVLHWRYRGVMKLAIETTQPIRQIYAWRVYLAGKLNPCQDTAL